MAWDFIKEFIINYSHRLILMILILSSASILTKMIKKYLKSILEKLEINAAVSGILIDILRFILWILVIALVLNILGLKEISLALGGSIAVLGLGVSKSISNVAGDLLAGIFLIVDEDFQVGVRVKIGAVEGIVEGLDIRKTKIRDVEGGLHIIPNKNVDNGILVIKEN